MNITLQQIKKIANNLNISYNNEESIVNLINILLQHEREECAKTLELNQSQILLLAGEMTAQELRTVKAVLSERARNIRKRTNVSLK